MVFCSKCGERLPENAYFCPRCGVKTIKGVEANVSMPYGDMFLEIGREMEKAFLVASEEMKKAFEKAREEIKRVTNRDFVVCPSCGKKSTVRDSFCKNCGKKLG